MQQIYINGVNIIATLNYQSLLTKQNGGQPPMVAVASAHDSHVLEAMDKAREGQVAEFTLFGDTGKIMELAAGMKISLKGVEVVHAGSDTEAAEAAVAMVRQGQAAAVMKGLLETSVIMKAALDKEKGIRTNRRLSHMAMFLIPAYHKPLYVTDAAVNIAPDLALKKDIVENAVEAVARLGVNLPKVALVCAKEKADPKMPVTQEYLELVQMNRDGELTGCIVDGPFALDNAVSKEAAQIKGIGGEVAGDADIILCPDIEAGNILYKSLTMFAGAAVGGVILGAKAPIILTSRSDSSENKLLSITLGAVIGGFGLGNETGISI